MNDFRENVKRWKSGLKRKKQQKIGDNKKYLLMLEEKERFEDDLTFGDYKNFW